MRDADARVLHLKLQRLPPHHRPCVVCDEERDVWSSIGLREIISIGWRRGGRGPRARCRFPCPSPQTPESAAAQQALGEEAQRKNRQDIYECVQVATAFVTVSVRARACGVSERAPWENRACTWFCARNHSGALYKPKNGCEKCQNYKNPNPNSHILGGCRRTSPPPPPPPPSAPVSRAAFGDVGGVALLRPLCCTASLPPRIRCARKGITQTHKHVQKTAQTVYNNQKSTHTRGLPPCVRTITTTTSACLARNIRGGRGSSSSSPSPPKLPSLPPPRGFAAPAHVRGHYHLLALHAGHVGPQACGQPALGQRCADHPPGRLLHPVVSRRRANRGHSRKKVCKRVT